MTNKIHNNPVQTEELTLKDKDDALGAYLMMFVSLIIGFPLPFLNIIASVIYLVIMKNKKKFVTFHCWQSFLSQLPITILNSSMIVWSFVKLIRFFSESYLVAEDAILDYTYQPIPTIFFTNTYVIMLVVTLLFNVVYVILSIIAIVKANQGRLMFFPIFGVLAYTIVYGSSAYGQAHHASANDDQTHTQDRTVTQDSRDASKRDLESERNSNS